MDETSRHEDIWVVCSTSPQNLEIYNRALKRFGAQPPQRHMDEAMRVLMASMRLMDEGYELRMQGANGTKTVCPQGVMLRDLPYVNRKPYVLQDQSRKALLGVVFTLNVTSINDALCSAWSFYMELLEHVMIYDSRLVAQTAPDHTLCIPLLQRTR